MALVSKLCNPKLRDYCYATLHLKEVRCESVTHFVLLLSKTAVLLLGTSCKCTETTDLLIYIKILRIYA